MKQANATFLAKIADPNHEEHEHLLRWACPEFDSSSFDPAVATKRMKKGLPDWRNWTISSSTPDDSVPRPPMADDIKIHVQEMEPGWVFVYFRSGKPPADQRPHWLERALRDWTVAHPGYSPTAVLRVEHETELFGLHAWFQISSTKGRTIAFDVSESVFNVHSQEYVEAVMDEVGTYIGMESLPGGRLAVVNRRGVATIFNAVHSHGRMMLVDELEPLLDGCSFTEFRIWLGDPKTTHFVVAIPDDG